MRVMLLEKNTVGPNGSEMSALVSKGPSSGTGSGPKQPRSKCWCDHCWKSGHTKNICWELHGKPADWKPRQGHCTPSYQATLEHPPAQSQAAHDISIGGFSSTQLEQLHKLFSSFQTSGQSSQNIASASLAHKGHLPLTFRTPPASPPRPSCFTGMRRVCSLEFRPHLINSPDSGLAGPLLGSGGSSGDSEQSLLPQSTIYNWSSGYFSKPLLPASDYSEEMLARREEREKFALEHIAKCQHSFSDCGTYLLNNNNQIAGWDTKFETGTKTTLLHPFSPIVIAADENARIRIWNYEEAIPLNSFDNHDYPEKGITKLCLINELDDSLLLAASGDGNIRIWKDYNWTNRQNLVTAFSSIQGHKPGVRCLNAVVDWQQQSGYLYSTGEISSIMLWDLDREQLVNSIPSSSDCSISALAASQVQGGQFAAGFVDASVRIYDVRTPEMLVCEIRPHRQNVERVVGIGYQPGLDSAKIVSASQAGDIQFLDTRNHMDAYLTIDAHRGSLTALAVHRHAPIIASGSSKQLIKVFSLKGKQLGTIQYLHTTMGQKISSVSCLTFHPYQVLLAAGAADG